MILSPPVEMTNGVQTRDVTTTSEYVRLKYNGWSIVGVGDPPDPYRPNVKSVNGEYGPNVVLDLDAIAEAIVAGAPAALDTLAEIADALNDDEDFAGTITGLLASKQPLAAALTQIAELDPGDDQAIVFDSTLGEWVVSEMPGGICVAQAAPITTAQTITSAGGTTLLTSTAISVEPSGGKSISLRFGGTFAQTVAGTGSAYLVLKETTSGAVDVALNAKNLPNSTAVQLSGITWGTQEADIGVVSSTRTFALYALVFAASGTPSISVYKSATNPLRLKAYTE